MKIGEILKSISFGAISLVFPVGLILFALINENGWIWLSIILFIVVSYMLGDVWRYMIKIKKNKED